MNHILFLIPLLLVVSVPVAFAEIVETKGQNYDLVENFFIGEAVWESHPERIMDGGWQNYALSNTGDKVIFNTNAVGSFVFDKDSCSYSIYGNGFDGEQIIPSVSAVATYLNNGQWQNLPINDESCTVTVDRYEDGVFLTSTKVITEDITEDVFIDYTGTTENFYVNATNSQFTLISNSTGNVGYFNGETVITESVEVEKFVQEIRLDINSGFKETFKVWHDGSEELGISQTIHSGESITIGDQTINIAELNGQSFDRQFIIDNEAEILAITDSVNYDFDTGIDSLSNINIIFDGDYKVNMDFASGDFVGYLEIDPTFTLSGTTKSTYASGGGAYSGSNSGGYIGGDGAWVYRSGFHWDISSISDSATITNTELQWDISYSNGVTNLTCDVNPISGTLSTDGGSTIHADVASGTPFVDNGTFCAVGVSTGNTLDLGSSADSDLESHLSTDEWGIGIVQQPLNTLSLRLMDFTNVELQVTYSVPTVPQAPTGLTTVTGVPIELDWSAPTDTGSSPITGYKVFRTLNEYAYTELPDNSANSAGIDFTDNELLLHGFSAPQYKVHTFTSDGTFQVTSGSGNVDYLVVGGGASGGGKGASGSGKGGGGGGAGQFLTGTSSVTAQSYSITVGSGGAAQTSQDTNGNDGSSSVFNSITSLGGGGGASGSSTVGSNGGSGGGGSSSGATNGAGGSGQATGGNNGGAGDSDNATWRGSGGGGGAGSAGSVPVSGTGGAGGAGISSSITGTATFYSAGGGGHIGGGIGGTGGSSIGGNGGAGGASGTDATGYGSGGGGAGFSASAIVSGAGSDGIVILRYVDNGSITATGGTVTTVSGTTSLPDKSTNSITVTQTNPSTSTTGVIGTGIQDPEFTFTDSNLPDGTDDFSVGSWVKLGTQTATFTTDNPDLDGVLRDDSNNNVCNTPTSRETSGITVEISSGRTGSVLDCKFGFFEFPISGIPSNAVVTNVDFEFGMYGVSSPRNCDYVDLGTVRPSTASDSDLFNEILLDNDYTDNDSTCAVDTGSTQSVTLGGDANSDVQSSISNGVFYFGVKYNDLTVPSSISESTFSSEEGTITPDPTLVVTYTIPTDNTKLLGLNDVRFNVGTTSASVDKIYPISLNDLLYYNQLEDISGSIENNCHDTSATSCDTDTQSTATNISSYGTTGILGNAIDIGSSVSHYELSPASTFSGQQDMTVNMWVKDGGHSADDYFFSTDWNGNNADYFTMHSATGTNIQCELRDTSPSVSISYSATTEHSNNDWDMFTCILDWTNDEIRLYVNGDLKGTSSSISSENGISWESSFAVGDKANSFSNRAVNAEIDEFSLFKRALSSDEISALYNTGSGLNLVTSAGSNTIISATGLTDNTSTAQHYTFTRDGNDWEIYQNGVSEATATDTTSLGANTGVDYTVNLDGMVDEYFINSDALTSTEVEMAYDKGSEPTQIDTTGSTTTDYDDSNVTGGTEYYYTVKATNAIGDSDFLTPLVSALAGTPPDVPTSVSSTINSPNTAPLDITVSWSAPTNVGTGTLTGFEIYRDSVLIDTTGLVTSYPDTVPSGGGTFEYKLKAVSTHGTSGFSSTTSTTTPSVPDAPAAPTGSINDPNGSPLDITVSWTAPNTGGSAITNYDLYRSSTSGSGFTIVQSGITGLTHTDTTPSAGTWYYTVAANNLVGSSAQSPELSVSTPSVPSAVSDLAGSTVSDTAINLTWSAPNNGGSNIIDYSVYRDGVSIDTVTTPGYSDTGLTQQTSYTYTVYARNNVGTSLVSNSISQETHGVPAVVPSFQATSAALDTITLSWTEPNDYNSAITSYVIERESPIGGGFQPLDTISPATTYSDTGLTSVQEYNYRIKAVNAYGNGPTTTASTITLPAPPTNVVVTPNTNPAELIITWDEPTLTTGITGYQILRENGVGSGFSPVTIVSGTNHTDTGLSTNVYYNYKLKSVTLQGNSESSNTYSQTTYHLPNAVESLTATSGELIDASLSWQSPTVPYGYITGYEIYQSTTGIPNTLIDITTATTFTATDLDPTVTYYWLVAPVTIHGSNSTGNIANATATSEIIIGDIELSADVNPDVASIDFDQVRTGNSTALTVTYPNTYDLTCEFDYKFARSTQSFSNLIPVTISPTHNSHTFNFNNSANEIISARCYNENTNPGGINPNDSNDGKDQINFSTQPIVTQVNDFQKGLYGISGGFGAFDLMTLFVVIVSMVGFNRKNPAVGVGIMVTFIGAMAYFGVIETPTIVMGAIALVAVLAIGIARNKL